MFKGQDWEEVGGTGGGWKGSVPRPGQIQLVYDTILRPDMVQMSETARPVVLLELTVPWEDRMEEASTRKRAK